MHTEELQEIFDWADKRAHTLYGWLRSLILLGSGSLSLLVALQPARPASAAAVACLKGTWVALGLGILFASLRLYGEVWTEKAKVERLVTMRTQAPIHGAARSIAPIVCTPPWYILKSEPACYISFVIAVALLVTAAVIST